MITVLNVENNNKSGVLELVSGIWKKGEVKAETKNSAGVRVKYLNCEKRGRKLNWDKIEEYAGTAKGYILCDNSVELPAKMGFKRFYSKSLYRLMSINGAIAVLSLLKGRCRKVTLCFCDKQGEYAKYAPLFVPLCGNMKVLTDSDVYQDFSDYAMGEYGACVEICTGVKELGNCNVFVSPRFVNLEQYTGAAAIMFTSTKNITSSRITTVDRYKWSLPKKYRCLKPTQMSNEYFSQALYSIAHCTDTALSAPHTFFSGTKKFKASDLAENIISLGTSALDTDRSKVYNKL